MLESLEIPYRCFSPSVDESQRPGEPPAELAMRLAIEKASSVASSSSPDEAVLAADTVVFIGERLLDKPSDNADARRTLRFLSGRAHTVVTAVALLTCDGVLQRLVRTSVKFRDLSDAEIDWYISTGEPEGKAGAYAIQGIGAFLVDTVEGSPSNVVGLPLAQTLELLNLAQVALPW